MNGILGSTFEDGYIYGFRIGQVTEVNKVYQVFAEWGEYSDHTSMCESVHLTYEGAVAAIRAHVETAVEELPGIRSDRPPYSGRTSLEDGDLLASNEVIVFRHPTDHGGIWYVDGDVSWDPWTWHIEEKELEP